MQSAAKLIEMLTPQQLAAELGVTVSTLARWRWAGKGPRYVKFGKHIRYRRTDVLEFVEESVCEHTASGFDGK